MNNHNARLGMALSIIINFCGMKIFFFGMRIGGGEHPLNESSEIVPNCS